MSDDPSNDPTFSLIAQSASSIAERTDALFTTMLVLCGAMALALAVLIVGFSIKYRAGTNVDRRDPPSHANGLEAGWTVIPLLLFFGVFAWGAYDYALARRVPPDALPIHVVGKQWMWRLQHGNGRQEIDELHVPVGRPVTLIMASQDVIHSFYVPAFRLKQDVVPGRYTRLTFTATKLGDYRLFCTEYCGSQHSTMLGKVVVMRQADYDRWLTATPAAPAGASTEPTPAQLEGGARVRADDDYLRRSIVDPKREIVRGQPASMPSYADQLNEEELQNLVAYLRALPPTP